MPFPTRLGQGNYSSRFSLLAHTSIVKSMEEWQHPPAAWTTSSLDYYNELAWETGLEKQGKSTDKAAPFVLIQDIKVVQSISVIRGRLPCALNSSTGFDQLLLYCKIRELGGDSWVSLSEDFLGLAFVSFSPWNRRNYSEKSPTMWSGWKVLCAGHCCLIYSTS